MKFIKSMLRALLFGLLSPAHADNQTSDGIGYATVDAALSALKTRADVRFATPKSDGWLIATEQATYAIWSFTPEGHYAHPAVVKRVAKQNAQRQVFIETFALCEADKVSCDRLMSEFEKLNAQEAEEIQKGIDR